MKSDPNYIRTEPVLGHRAPDRGEVDLVAEALRLKFSADEVAELKRLYEKEIFPANAPRQNS